ncbi:MAG: hypothetical protein OXF21_04730 [bacterium]|nr:hypothetical protein [bacterium]
MKFVQAMGLAVVLLLCVAACNNDSQDNASSSVATSVVAEAEAPAATQTSVVEQAPEPPQTEMDDQVLSDQMPSLDQFRNFVMTGLIEENGVSEASAQCVGDNISEDLFERYMVAALDNAEAAQPYSLIWYYLLLVADLDNAEAAQPVFAELFQIQSSCLTPEELEKMGIAPADG